MAEFLFHCLIPWGQNGKKLSFFIPKYSRFSKKEKKNLITLPLKKKKQQSYLKLKQLNAGDNLISLQY